MGIIGLLPLLKDIQFKTSIVDFKGQTVGIDVYCWLHKGAYACAQDLIMGKPTRVYVHYVMKRVRMLISYNITPILVFDGGHLPAKAEKERERRLRRKEYREKGLAALRAGKTSEAFDAFQKSCDITPEMASNVIEECYKLNVKCIVAPYEADAQLAYLMLNGITQLTISEDSDLLLYGCNKVLYKMSADGDGVLIDMSNLAKVRTVKLATFTAEQFRWMCMLSGCDYLPSIKGMGLMKAHKLLQRYKTVKQCIRAMKIDRNFFVPDDYEENFRKVEMVFKYQVVFDPREKKAAPLNNIGELEESTELSDADREYAGALLDRVKAIAIALGNLDPISGKTMASRRDFASGEIQMKPQKSSSWTSAHSQSKQCHIQNKIPNKLPTKPFARKSKLNTSAVDITPPDSQTQSNNLESKKKSLFSSPKTEAEKSLKRLRSELAVEETSREDKFKRLYECQTSVPSSTKTSLNQPNPPRHQHHSVFTKNKFSNPFRQKVADVSSTASPNNNTVVVSRFFSSTSTTRTSRNGSDQPNTQTSEIESGLNSSFVDYLDRTNCRMSGVEKIDSSPKTPKNPKTTPRQMKLDKIVYPIKQSGNGNKECLSDIDEPCAVRTKESEEAPLRSALEFPACQGEAVDFSVCDREEAEVYVNMEKTVPGNLLKNETNPDDNVVDVDEKELLDHTVLCEDSSSDYDSSPSSPSIVSVSQQSHVSECDQVGSREPSQRYNSSQEQSSQTSKTKVKVGLSKNNCKGVGVSSFVVDKKQSQISTCLEKFKKVTATTAITGGPTSSSESRAETGYIKRYLDEEVLPKRNSAVDSLLPANQAPKRLKPIGLQRRKKKEKLSKSPSSDDTLKQTKLSFDKFAFKRKSIFKGDTGDVICLS